jgi:hypothetical protein
MYIYYDRGTSFIKIAHHGFFYLATFDIIGVIDARSLQIKDYTFSLSSSGGCSTDKLSATGYTFDIAVSMWKPLQN